MTGPWLNSKPQQIEYRTSECRITKDGITALGLFYSIDRTPSFDIRYSLFYKLRKAEVSFVRGDFHSPHPRTC